MQQYADPQTAHAAQRDVITEGWSIHEPGTARMGSDPKSSATSLKDEMKKNL